MNQQEVYQFIQKYQPNICQINVLQNGNELYSTEWNGYRKTDCVHIASATKSVMALLIGIAIDHKMIGSVNDKVLSYFPEYSAKRGEKTIFDVTIRHLLTMRAPYKGHGDPWTKVCSSEDWTKASLDFLGGKSGITDDFDYRTVCLQNGTWNRKKIISSEWLREILSPRRIESGAFSGMSYGYLWWIVHPERNVYAAVGDSGNVIYVDPNEKIIVAVSSYFRPAVHDRIDFIEHILLPVIQKR